MKRRRKRINRKKRQIKKSRGWKSASTASNHNQRAEKRGQKE